MSPPSLRSPRCAAIVQFGRRGSGLLLAGAIFGVLGAVITIVCNVPLNSQLDAVDPAAVSLADAAAEWQSSFTTWTAWNHARTVTAVVASGLMLIGLRYR